MNTTHLTAESFLCGVYEYHEENLIMQSSLNVSGELEGGFSFDPSLPGIVSLDVSAPLRELLMYTNSLEELSAPPELCIQKALELISSRGNYPTKLEAFRMELLAQAISSMTLDSDLELAGMREVNALVSGIERICKFLLASFDKVMKSHADFFPYEFYQLHNGRYLFLSKIVIDATLPGYLPTVIPRPAYAHQGVQESYRANYFASADQCPIL